MNRHDYTAKTENLIQCKTNANQYEQPNADLLMDRHWTNQPTPVLDHQIRPEELGLKHARESKDQPFNPPIQIQSWTAF